MYEYKFLRVELEGICTRKPKADHHRLRDEYSNYRLFEKDVE